MKGKILALILVLSLVASLGFAAGTTEKKTTQASAASGEPKYGGTLTQFQLYNNNEPPDWDPVKAAGPQVIAWSVPVMDQALEGDIEKFGPRGTGEYGFTTPDWVDEGYDKGSLVESWEWSDPLTLVFHVRKGVKFSGISVNPGVMQARELVAEDFVYQLKRMKTSTTKGQLWDWVAETSAPDKYTWVVKFKQYYADWSWWLASAFMQIYPKEVIDAGASDWKNLTGAGPFVLKEYVRGSHGTYEKNPNYWGTMKINGKEYKTPFIDKFIWPVIQDESTQIASLRTGKIDWATSVSPRYGDTLAKTSPNLVKYPYLMNGSLAVALQSSTSKYFKDEKVRRAMWVGTDLATIGANAWGKDNFDINPTVKGSALYIPIEKMPASTQELFKYDPAKAKKMLADAGYPDGFKIEMTYCPSQTSYQTQDIASMIVDMWSKIGVTVTLKPVEDAVMSNLTYGHTYTDSLLTGRSYMTGGVSMAMGVKGHEENTSDWDNSSYTESYNKAFSERDPVKSLAIKKDMTLKHLDSASMVFTPVHANYCYTWPWVKNYYGEISTGFLNYNPMLRTIWIDQDQKKKMGF